MIFLFMINNKSLNAAQCVKSRILTKAIYYILSIETFEQKCVVIKCMLQSSRLEYRIKNIGIDQSLCTRYSSEHKCMNNIKKIYRHAGNCDDQQNLKDILYAYMVSTLKGVTDNSSNVTIISTPFKRPSARKSLCLFTNVLDAKRKTEKRRIVAA